MDQITANSLTLHFEPQDRDAAVLISETCEATAHLLATTWGLAAPADCHVYVLSNPEAYLQNALPARWRGLLAPLLRRRLLRLWPMAGGWALRIGRRHTIAVKPPRLIAESDRRLGERLFSPEENLEEKVRHITAHELTHAFSAGLRLPPWLNEGLAMLTVDRLLGKVTVLADSVQLLAAVPDQRLRGYGNYKEDQHDALLRLYARGYWLTRYLDEQHPALLRDLLRRRLGPRRIEARLAVALNLPRRALWPEIDALLLRHYGG